MLTLKPSVPSAVPACQALENLRNTEPLLSCPGEPAGHGALDLLSTLTFITCQAYDDAGPVCQALENLWDTEPLLSCPGEPVGHGAFALLSILTLITY
eukprot:1161296-Pelagomonas_calceolata.AAC.14